MRLSGLEPNPPLLLQRLQQLHLPYLLRHPHRVSLINLFHPMHRLDLQPYLLPGQVHRPNRTGTYQTLLLKTRYQVSCMSHALVVPRSQQATCLELYGHCNNIDGELRKAQQGAHFRL